MYVASIYDISVNNLRDHQSRLRRYVLRGFYLSSTEGIEVAFSDGVNLLRLGTFRSTHFDQISQVRTTGKVGTMVFPGVITPTFITQTCRYAQSIVLAPPFAPIGSLAPSAAPTGCSRLYDG